MNICKHIANQIIRPVYSTTCCIVFFFSMQHLSLCMCVCVCALYIFIYKRTLSTGFWWWLRGRIVFMITYVLRSSYISKMICGFEDFMFHVYIYIYIYIFIYIIWIYEMILILHFSLIGIILKRFYRYV